MTNESKRVGSQFETDVVAYLRDQGIAAERLRLAGSDDEGDIVVGAGDYLIEAKARRDAKSSLNLHAWLTEAHTESANYARRRNRTDTPVALLVVKNPRKPIGKAFVVTYLEDLIPDDSPSE